VLRFARRRPALCELHPEVGIFGDRDPTFISAAMLVSVFVAAVTTGTFEVDGF
jgi:hypothetical protein